ncbi:hypothetical protein OA860_02605 [Prochlorococcus sp. AH-716-E13]|nr:hypothetical protein [Prochlorococcus sp. AH-716-E13]
MPTKKKRVGFIPRSDVLNLLNQLSFESNLSISKIINILVEEALYKRGLFNFDNGGVFNQKNPSYFNKNKKINIQNVNKDFSNEVNEDFIDKEIYTKFLMFLQFQEIMKKVN